MKLSRGYTALVALATVRALPVDTLDGPGADVLPKYSPLDSAGSLLLPSERRARLPFYNGVRLPPQTDDTVTSPGVAPQSPEAGAPTNDTT
ncbi:hypothetical protein B0H16DRAFT_1888661 [Mycena metata]|uniref:Uncharacterized protein n=1 Tax=Mycena metata TaxID=1033252 RepID=A0AAD7IR38_9AGAR|nr:hypothetical protein B0H16DRAFT_1888661 [Mycena metata]